MAFVTSLPLSPAYPESPSDQLGTMHYRLRRARLLAGFATSRAAIVRFGWKASTYRAHENGQNGFRPADAFVYARAFKVSPTWLLVGEYGGATAAYEDVPATEDPLNQHSAYEAAKRPVVFAGAPADQFDLRVDADTLADMAREGDVLRFRRPSDHEILSDGDIVAIEQPAAHGVDICIRRVFFRDGLTFFSANDLAQAAPIPHGHIVGVAIWLLRRLAN